MAKNILIFADGTGNYGQPHRPTNVYKLFQMTFSVPPDQQIAFYQEGVGSRLDFIGFMTGLGISKNIQACYKFLCRHYQPGDKVFLFGFSRGAATVRSLSGLTDLLGVSAKMSDDDIVEAFEIYKIQDSKKRAEKAARFRSSNESLNMNVHFLGAWDTVVSLGFIFEFLNSIFEKRKWLQVSFHDFHLSPLVQHARHALALDEKRFVFSAKLWDSLPMAHQSLKQVWFSGTHKNVGGGWSRDHALSDLALQWMIAEARAEGLILSSDHTVQMNPDPAGHIAPTLRMTNVPRTWDRQRLGKPIVHHSVLERQKRIPSYRPWILLEDFDLQE